MTSSPNDTRSVPAPTNAQAEEAAAIAARLTKARAIELGFSLVGIARADVALQPEHARYIDAITRGLHGPLAYVAENAEVRARVDGADILEGARSIVVLAARHDGPPDDGEIAGAIARYARGRDYHNFMRKKLRALARFVRQLAPDVQARPMSDTAPVLERAWASRAGIGFVGKHGLVIAPGVGSFFLIGEVVTTIELAVDAPMEERCGRCTRCIDACPTSAIIEPFVLDASRCIATWTIEMSGSIPMELRDACSHHLFGCDICQDVCPFNAKERPPPPFESRHRSHERWQSLTLCDLAKLGMPDGPNVDDVLSGTPLSRAGSEGLARNAAAMLAHRRDSVSLATLELVASRHPSEVVRDAARWALLRRGTREAGSPNDAGAG